MKYKDTVGFIGFAMTGISLLGTSFLLYKIGNGWIAKRFILSGFTIILWCTLYIGCKEGQMNFITKSDRPVLFCCIKYTNLVIDILMTIGVCYYWVKDNL